MSSVSGLGGGGDIAEIQARMEQMRAQRFTEADVDGSGALTRDEFDASVASSPIAGVLANNGRSSDDLFARLDADGDGEVTETEMSSASPMGAGSLSSDMMSMLLSMQGSGAGQGFGAGGQAFDPMALFGGESNEDGSEWDPLAEFLDALNESGSESEETEERDTSTIL